MAVCSPFDPDDLKDKYTNVEYSEDGSITIYMDGSAPVPANRALTNKLAQLAYDFFEVTFLFNTDDTAANYKIARASWELGEPAGISDVYRGNTSAGVIYYNTAAPLGATGTGIPARGEGLVVLFVGRKSDKTLLAVGTLREINGEVVSSTNNSISLTTAKIKFNVNALKAGVSIASYGASSFKTAIAQSDPLTTIMIGTQPFPHFNVPVNVTTSATYTFGFNSPALEEPATAVNFAFYAPAIKYGASAAECWNIEPKYTLPPNIVQKNMPDGIHYTSGLGIVPQGLPALNTPFSGVIGFAITPVPNVDGVICALAFQVPVYAVYRDADPVQWFIRPGYTPYHLDLDNGKMENGGAVLISVGTIQAGQSFGIIMDGEPLKYMATNRGDFTLEGMEFFFKLSGTSTIPLILTSMTDGSASGGNYPYAYGWGPNIKFYFDNGTPPTLGANQTPPLSNLDDIAETEITGSIILPFGLVKIRMEYKHSDGQTYSYMFYVEVNNISQVIEIPYERRFFITKAEDYTDAWNRISGDDYLFVFAQNLNLPHVKVTLSGNANVFMVATVPNITIGRENGNADSEFVTGNYNLNIYLGKWPFNEPAFAGGDVIVNELFRVSSAQTWEAWLNGAQANTDMFIVDTGTPGTGSIKVNVLAGIEVSNINRIGPH